MNGPDGNHRSNMYWSDDMFQIVEKNKWKIITPSVLLLSSIASKMGYQVEIADEEFRTLEDRKKYDIVCFYTVTPNANRAYKLADEYRKKGSWVVIGGVHSTFMKREAKPHCDTLLCGEGEYIFKDFLEDYYKGVAKDYYEQKNGKVRLKDSPTPLYELLNMEERKLIPIQTARGCSHNCRFCNVKSLYGNNFRRKSYQQIRKELIEIVKISNTKKVYVTDDNIMSDLNHFYQLIELFKQMKFIWYANTDISFGANEKNIKNVYKAGLRQVLIGFESVQLSSLKKLDKDNYKYKHLKKYKEYIHKIQTNGIGIVGSFIIGQVHDTEDTFQYLEEFIYETKLYGANVTVMTPYPGTMMYHQMLKENRILTKNWDYYTIFQPVLKIDHISTEKFNYYYNRLLNNVHSRDFVQNKIKYFNEVYKNNVL